MYHHGEYSHILEVKVADNTWHKAEFKTATSNNVQVILKDGSLIVPGTDTRLMPDGLVKTWQWAFTGDDDYMKGRDYPKMEMSIEGPDSDGFFKIKCTENDGDSVSYLALEPTGWYENRAFFGTLSQIQDKEKIDFGYYNFRLFNLDENDDFDPAKPFIAYLIVDDKLYLFNPNYVGDITTMT